MLCGCTVDREHDLSAANCELSICDSTHFCIIKYFEIDFGGKLLVSLVYCLRHSCNGFDQLGSVFFPEEVIEPGPALSYLFGWVWHSHPASIHFVCFEHNEILGGKKMRNEPTRWM